MRMRSGGWGIAVLAFVLTGMVGVTLAQRPGVSSTGRLADQSNGADWPGYGRTFGEQHFSPLRQINDADVKDLGLAWSMDIDSGSTVTQPLAIDGVLYFANGYSLINAVDAASGKLLWRYDAKVADVAGPKMRVSWGMRGIAWWNGKIYFGTVDGRLIAIDAKTGKAVWSTQTTQPGDSRYITGAPRVFHGVVIVGHGGADVGPTRGYVTAYDAESGKQLWRFYTVPGNPADGFENDAMKLAAKTWAGEWWKVGGGGTVWNAMAYDPETDTVYLGTGNGTPWNQKARSPGDNLFLCSIVALDARTGKYKWHYQVNPGESWDYNAAMDIELADLSIGGHVRKVMMTAPKNGFFYVIDRGTGELLSAKPFVKVNWADHIDLKTGRPVENPAARYPNGSTFVMWPSPLGGHNWLPMAYSPQTSLVYIPSIEKAAAWTDAPGVTDGTWLKDVPPNLGFWGAAVMNMYPKTGDPLDGTSALIAWDPVRQKEVWRWPTASVAPGGVMATAGNLVFQGSIDGAFRAHAADSGKVLWSFPSQAAVIAPPITYTAGGRQYVTVLTGMGTSIGALGPLLQRFELDYHNQPKRVLTFVLNGKATLPPRETFKMRPAFQDPNFKPNDPLIAKGAFGYAERCSGCHGGFAISSGVAPDLRRSPIPPSAGAFTAIVRGALVDKGMPAFADLSEDDIAVIREYVRTQAAALRKQEAH